MAQLLVKVNAEAAINQEEEDTAGNYAPKTIYDEKKTA